MKKLVVFLLFAVLLVSSGIAISYELKGDFNSARPFEAVSIACMVVPAIASRRVTHSVGMAELFFVPENAPRVFSRAHKHLLDYLNGNLPGTKPKAEILQKLSNGDLKVIPYRKSLLFKLTPNVGGRIALLNVSTPAFNGRIPDEFDKGQLPSGSIVCFDFARLGYGTDGTSLATLPEAIASYSNITDNWPAAIANAHLIWTSVNDIKFEIKAKAFGVKAAGNRSSVKDDGYQFPEPILIEEKKQNKLELNCPDNLLIPNAATTSYCLEFEMDGAAIIATK